VSVSGKLFKAVQYGVRPEDGRIDYDQVAALAREHRPRLLVAGASAYPRVIDFERFGSIAREVGATLVVDMAHIAGLVAAGLHPSPVPHADLVTSTTHKTLRGPRGGFVLARSTFAEKLDKSMFPGLQGGPLMHVIAAKAVCFGEALTEGFVAYQRRVVENARTLAETLQKLDFDLVSGGTDNHLLLVDLRRRGMTGKTAEEALHRARMTVNKNAVPNDPHKPWITSGIRVGTPALTTRGFGGDQMRQIGAWIARILDRPDDLALAAEVSREVEGMASRFPLFAWEPALR
jgi:glycine hydroxymethyltransferase